MWPKTEELLGQLYCRMTEDEVAAVVGEFRGLEFLDSRRERPWDKVARTGGTTIALDFDDNGLRQAEVSWIDGVLSVDSLPIHDFCANAE